MADRNPERPTRLARAAIVVSLAAATVLLGVTMWTVSDRAQDFSEQARRLHEWRGEVLPQFDLTLVADGRPSTIRDLLADDQPLVVVFLDPDCPACRGEFEALRAEAPTYADRVRIVVVGVTDRASTERLAASAGSALCVAWDSAAAFRNRALGASIVPLVLVADPYGIVTEVLVGARPPEFVGAFLSSLGARAGEERRP